MSTLKLLHVWSAAAVLSLVCLAGCGDKKADSDAAAEATAALAGDSTSLEPLNSAAEGNSNPLGNSGGDSSAGASQDASGLSSNPSRAAVDLPSAGATGIPPSTPPVEAQAGQAAWISTAQLPWEASFLQYVGNVRIGYTYIRITPGELAGSNLLNISRSDSIEFTRAEKKSRITVNLEASETTAGSLKKFTETTINGSTKTVASGQTLREVLTITTKVGDTAERRNAVNMADTTWGAMGVQAILMRNPMTPGESRVAKVFLPQLKRIVDVELNAGEPEQTAVPEMGPMQLLPVDLVMKVDENNGIRSRNWVNDQGEIQKTVTLSGLDMSTFRTTKDVVERMRDGYLIDEMKSTGEPFAIPLAGRVPNAGKARQVTYKIEGLDLNPYDAIRSSGNQSLKSLSARSAGLIVDRWTNADFPKVDPPTELTPYTGPSKLVQSDDEVIESLRKEWLPDELPAVDTVRRLNAAVSEKMTLVPGFSSEFLNALQVSKSLAGDGGEYSVLLMALLRNAGIPAQAVCGLRVEPQTRDQLVLHIWVEAWVDDHWLPLDPTTGKLTDTDYIKFQDSPLSNANPFEFVMPVLEHMQQLEIAVATAQ